MNWKELFRPTVITITLTLVIYFFLFALLVTNRSNFDWGDERLDYIHDIDYKVGRIGPLHSFFEDGGTLYSVDLIAFFIVFIILYSFFYPITCILIHGARKLLPKNFFLAYSNRFVNLNNFIKKYKLFIGIFVIVCLFIIYTAYPKYAGHSASVIYDSVACECLGYSTNIMSKYYTSNSHFEVKYCYGIAFACKKTVEGTHSRFLYDAKNGQP